MRVLRLFTLSMNLDVIEKYIKASLKTGEVLSIKTSKTVTPIVTAVESYLPSAEYKVVKLKPFNLYGEPVENREIFLTDIEKVVPLNVRYDDHPYRMVREKKRYLNF